MTPEEFRVYAHQIVDWIADYRATVQDRAVMSKVAPGQVASHLPASAPEQPQPFDAVMADLNEIILPGMSHFQHPSFYGYFPANSSLASLLGDFVSGGFGVVGLNWQAAPALTEVEEVTMNWLRQLVGLSEAWQGVIQDTASTSTMVALISARERATNYALAHGGLQSAPAPLIVYGSEHAHSSVEKAALLAGFGKENLRYVAVDENYAIRPDALEEAIRADVAKGNLPCAIVATAGTTGTTAVDPIEAIAAISKKFNIWLHIDSAMAGSAMILPECRWMWKGIEGADSIVLNPHKWLGVAFDCSAYFVRDPQHLVRVMSTNPSYLQTSADGNVKNYRDWGIPLGRRFRALKLWMMLRLEGAEALRARLRRDMANAQWLAAQVDGTPGWRVLAPVHLQTVCVRHEPAGLSGEALDKHTLAWANAINKSGKAYLTPSILDGRWMVRVSIGAENTEREHVAALWDEMQLMASRW